MAHNARAVFEARFCAETIYAQLADHLESLATRTRPGNAENMHRDDDSGLVITPQPANLPFEFT
jgi:hypothetical protein